MVTAKIIFPSKFDQFCRFIIIDSACMHGFERILSSPLGATRCEYSSSLLRVGRHVSKSLRQEELRTIVLRLWSCLPLWRNDQILRDV